MNVNDRLEELFNIEQKLTSIIRTMPNKPNLELLQLREEIVGKIDYYLSIQKDLVAKEKGRPGNETRNQSEGTEPENPFTD